MYYCMGMSCMYCIKKILSFSVWWDIPTSAFFHSRPFCFRVNRLPGTPQLNETVKHDIRESDRHDRRYMYIPSFALSIYKTACHDKPYLCCCCFCCCWWWCCYCTTYYWLVLLGVFSFSSNSLAKATWSWMLLHRTLRKVPGTTKVRLWEKNMWVVTPRCAAAAVVSAVVLRRPTKEYTHRYSMIHCRFTTTAGIEVAPHYHQLLVVAVVAVVVIVVC